MKPHAGHFKSGDARANKTGQRNKAAVETSVQARALYVQVLNETETAPPENATNLEIIVRRHVHNARNGDTGERELVFDRIWGKSAQPHEVGGKDGADIKVIVEYVRNTPTTS